MWPDAIHDLTTIAERVKRKYFHRECHYCGGLFTYEHMSNDHIIPRALGGPNAQWNLVRACKQCNKKKGSMTYEQFTGLAHLPMRCWKVAMTTDEFLRNNT